jgi:hypothetical protein
LAALGIAVLSKHPPCPRPMQHRYNYVHYLPPPHIRGVPGFTVIMERMGWATIPPPLLPRDLHGWALHEKQNGLTSYHFISHPSTPAATQIVRRLTASAKGAKPASSFVGGPSHRVCGPAALSTGAVVLEWPGSIGDHVRRVVLKGTYARLQLLLTTGQCWMLLSCPVRTVHIQHTVWECKLAESRQLSSPPGSHGEELRDQLLDQIGDRIGQAHVGNGPPVRIPSFLVFTGPVPMKLRRKRTCMCNPRSVAVFQDVSASRESGPSQNWFPIGSHDQDLQPFPYPIHPSRK